MKIITIDNFGRESVAQHLVASNIGSKHEAMIMLNALRESCGPHDSVFYRLIEDDHVLWRGMAEFADESCEFCGCPDGSCCG